MKSTALCHEVTEKTGQEAWKDVSERICSRQRVLVRLALIGLTFAWLALDGSAGAQFTDLNAGLPGVDLGSAAWSDYDADGDLDFLLAGSTATSRLCRVYRNNGDNTFADAAAGLPGISNCAAAWGDYDGDGDQDLLLAGYTGSARFSRVYRNDGAAGFTDIAAGLPGTNSGAAAWGDCDGDGDLDLLLTGSTGAARISRIYRNDLQANGTRAFVDIAAGLPGIEKGSAALGDYDGDGDLDVLLAGYTGSANICRIYRNSGGTFADVNAGLPGTTNTAAAWGDLDGDGDLDLALTGLLPGNIRASRVYRNNGNGSFTDIAAGLPGIERGAVAWGDCDADGDLDLALAGWTGSARIAGIYLNNGGGAFADAAAGLTGVEFGALAWGDCDADGDLDLLLTGSTGTTRVATLYRNDQASNDPPVADAGGPYVVESAGAGTLVQLDGTASDDPDGDPLVYQWSSDCPAAAWDDPASATPALTLGDGHPAVYEITLMVADYPAGQIAVTTTTLTVVDTTAPTITCPADIIQEPASPAGNVVNYAPVATDACDPSPVLVSDPPSGNVFLPGTTTTVRVTATDATGNSAQSSFTVKILSAAEVVQTLQTSIGVLVGAGELSAGESRSFTSVLDAAQGSLARGKTESASGQLQAFINKVNAMIGNGRLSPEAGNALIDSANNLRATLNPGAR